MCRGTSTRYTRCGHIYRNARVTRPCQYGFQFISHQVHCNGNGFVETATAYINKPPLCPECLQHERQAIREGFEYTIAEYTRLLGMILERQENRTPEMQAEFDSGRYRTWDPERMQARIDRTYEKMAEALYDFDMEMEVGDEE